MVCYSDGGKQRGYICTTAVQGKGLGKGLDLDVVVNAPWPIQHGPSLKDPTHTIERT